MGNGTDSILQGSYTCNRSKFDDIFMTVKDLYKILSLQNGFVLLSTHTEQMYYS